MAQGQRSRPEGAMPTLRDGAEAHSFSEASMPGPEVACRQVRGVRAETSHPNVPGGDTGGRFRCGADEDLSSFRQTIAASGSRQPVPLDGRDWAPNAGGRGKRAWRTPKPHLLFGPQGARGDVQPSIRVSSKRPADITVGGPFCAPRRPLPRGRAQASVEARVPPHADGARGAWFPP